MALTTPALVRLMLELARSRHGDPTPVTDADIQTAITNMMNRGESKTLPKSLRTQDFRDA